MLLRYQTRLTPLCLQVANMFALLLTIVTIVSCQVTAPPDATTGVVIEKLRQVALTGSKWHVVVHYNLSELFQSAEQLADDVKSLELHIQETAPLSVRQGVLWEVSWLRHHAQDYRDRLGFIKTFIPHHRILARALFQPMGTLYHYLFGLTTDKEVKHLKERLEDQDAVLAHHGQAQLSILKEEEDKIANHTIILRQLIVELNNTQVMVAKGINDIQADLHLQQTLGKWSSLRAEAFMELQEATTNLQRFQTAVEAAGRGQLTTDIINPNYLSKLLSQVQQELRHLNNSLTLPFDLSNEEIYWYYQAAAVKIGVSQEDFLYAITIPLLDRDTIFDLYRLHALPVYDSELNVWMQWGHLHEYIAVDQSLSTYILLDEPDLNQCTDGIPAICTIKTPMYTSSRPACEFSLLNGSMVHCERTIVRQREPTFRYVGSHWAYSISGQLNFTVRCPGEGEKTVTVTHCGLLHDHANCTLAGPDFLLVGQTTVQTVDFRAVTGILTPLTPVLRAGISPITKEERRQLLLDPSKFEEMMVRLPSTASSLAVQQAIAQLNASYEDAVMRNHHWRVLHWTAGTTAATIAIILVAIVLFKLIPWYKKPPVVVMNMSRG